MTCVSSVIAFLRTIDDLSSNRAAIIVVNVRMRVSGTARASTSSSQTYQKKGKSVKNILVEVLQSRCIINPNIMSSGVH